MKTFLSWVAQIAALVALGYGAFLFLTKTDDETTAQIDQPEAAAATLNLPVVTLEPVSVTPHYVSLGKVEAWQSSNLATQANGRIVWVCECFEEGAQVSAGQRLLQVDDTAYRRDVLEREKDLGNARAALVSARADTEQARENYARLDLGEPSDVVLKIPELNAAILAVSSAEAALEIAQTALAETVVTAPYRGVISAANVTVGDLVGASSNLGALVGTDRFRVRFPILETQLDLVRIGAQIDITTTTIPVITKAGRIEAIDIDIDSATRLNSVIVSMPDPLEGEAIRLGRFVNGTFSGPTLENLFAIPLTALDIEEQYYTLDDQNRLVPMAADPVYRDFGAVYIPAGEQTQLRIVTGNVLGLRAGMLVSGYSQ